VDEWPEAPKGDEMEIAALVVRLRARIQDEGLREEGVA